MLQKPTKYYLTSALFFFEIIVEMMARYAVHVPAILNTVKGEQFLNNSCTTISFSKKILLHVIS